MRSELNDGLELMGGVWGGVFGVNRSGGMRGGERQEVWHRDDGSVK